MPTTKASKKRAKARARQRKKHRLQNAERLARTFKLYPLLPAELRLQIAGLVVDRLQDRRPIGVFACLDRLWQAVVEPRTFRDLTITAEDITAFERLCTGARRGYLVTLRLHIYSPAPGLFGRLTLEEARPREPPFNWEIVRQKESLAEDLMRMSWTMREHRAGVSAWAITVGEVFDDLFRVLETWEATDRSSKAPTLALRYATRCRPHFSGLVMETHANLLLGLAQTLAPLPKLRFALDVAMDGLELRGPGGLTRELFDTYTWPWLSCTPFDPECIVSLYHQVPAVRRLSLNLRTGNQPSGMRAQRAMDAVERLFWNCQHIVDIELLFAPWRATSDILRRTETLSPTITPLTAPILLLSHRLEHLLVYHTVDVELFFRLTIAGHVESYYHCLPYHYRRCQHHRPYPLSLASTTTPPAWPTLQTLIMHGRFTTQPTDWPDVTTSLVNAVTSTLPHMLRMEVLNVYMYHDYVDIGGVRPGTGDLTILPDYALDLRVRPDRSTTIQWRLFAGEALLRVIGFRLSNEQIIEWHEYVRGRGASGLRVCYGRFVAPGLIVADDDDDRHSVAADDGPTIPDRWNYWKPLREWEL